MLEGRQNTDKGISPMLKQADGAYLPTMRLPSAPVVGTFSVSRLCLLLQGTNDLRRVLITITRVLKEENN